MSWSTVCRSRGEPAIQIHLRSRQLTVLLKGALQENFADDVLQISLALLEDSIMRVRSHSAASLTNFFQEASPRHFEKYLEPVVCGLLNLYQSQVLYAQDQALATLGEYYVCS